MLQSSLEVIHEWIDIDRTVINSPKSEDMVFTCRKYTHIPSMLNGWAVSWSDKAKYLGFIMKAKRKFKEYILTKCK